MSETASFPLPAMIDLTVGRQFDYTGIRKLRGFSDELSVWFTLRSSTMAGPAQADTIITLEEFLPPSRSSACDELD